MFADLVGFTALSESLDPEDVLAIQDAYFEAARATVARHRGQLEKFIGDAVVAVFGVPRTADDDAVRAVRAGCALVAAVDRVSASVGLERGRLAVRVGVNTGEVMVAEGGADRGPVTGDTVNVAARLQAAAQPGVVVIGSTTMLAVEDAFELEVLRPLELKGKERPVRCARVRVERPVASRDEALGGLRAPLLGRQQELRHLGTLVDRADAGRPTQILVIAPPGTGKTRLVTELAHSLARDGVLVRRARARPDTLAPFDPVAQLATAALATARPGGLAAALDLDPVLGAKRAEVEEQFATLTGAPTSERAAPADRAARFDAWLDAFDALSGDAVDVWIVEDVHWATGDALAFLASAPARAGSRRVVVATARPSLRERLPDNRSAAEGYEILELSPLAAADAARLVEALVGDALSAELVDAIAERADGNPLFIEELIRTWIGAGLLVRSDTGWRAEADPGEIAVPQTVQAIYGAQLDDLPDEARELARRAAVVGRRFATAALAPVGISAPGNGLAVLTRRGFVSGPVEEPPLGPTFAYRHALLRDAGYASLPRAERALLHVRLAEWLERDAPADADDVAELVGRHYAAALSHASALGRELAPGVDTAEASRRAAAWLERAAEQALRLSGFETARSALALALAHTAPDAVLDRARRLRLLGDATAFAADMTEGADLLEEAVALARDEFERERGEAQRSEYAAAAASLGAVRNQQLHFAEAAELAEAALADVGFADDAVTARLLLMRGWAEMHATDEWRRPLADAERARRIARELGSGGLELKAVELLLAARSHTEDVAPGEWRSLADLALAERDWRGASRALRTTASEVMDSRPADALAMLEEAERIAGARSLTEELAWCGYLRTETLFLTGDWDRALTVGLETAERGEAHDYHRVVVRTWHVLGAIAAARRERALLTRIADWYDARHEEYQRIDSLYSRITGAANRLRCARCGVRPPYLPEVEPRLPAFELGYTDPSWLASVEEVVEGWLAAGERDGAAEAVARLRRVDDRVSSAALARAVTDLLAARVAESGGVTNDEQKRCARAALETFATIGALWWEAKALRLLARAGAADADTRRAEAIEASLGTPSA
jgi:class 3 adenylate cyclase